LVSPPASPLTTPSSCEGGPAIAPLVASDRSTQPSSVGVPLAEALAGKASSHVDGACATVSATLPDDHTSSGMARWMLTRADTLPHTDSSARLTSTTCKSALVGTNSATSMNPLHSALMRSTDARWSTGARRKDGRERRGTIHRKDAKGAHARCLSALCECESSTTAS
jgi:hypothetical protein